MAIKFPKIGTDILKGTLKGLANPAKALMEGGRKAANVAAVAIPYISKVPPAQPSLLNPQPLLNNFKTALPEANSLPEALAKGAGGLFSKSAKGLMEAGHAAIGQFPAGVGNTVKGMMDFANNMGIDDLQRKLNIKFTDAQKQSILKNQVTTQIGDSAQGAGNWLGNQVSEVGSKLSKLGLKGYEVDPNSAMSQAGKFAGNLAAEIPFMIGGGKLAQGVQKAIGAAHPIMGAMAGGATGGAAYTTGSTLAEEARMPTGGELAVGAGVGGIIGGLAQGLHQLKRGLYRTGLEPATSTNSKDPFAFKEKEALIDKALQKGYTGSKRSIFAKAQKDIEKAGQELSKIVEKSKMVWKRDDLVNSAVERATELEKIGAFDRAKAIMKYVDYFRKAGKDNLTATDILGLKRKARDLVLNQILKGNMDDIWLSGEMQTWEEIYKNAGNALNQVSPRAATLNNIMHTGYSFRDAAGVALGRPINLASLNISKIPSATFLTTKAAGLANIASKISTPVAQQGMAAFQRTGALGKLSEGLSRSTQDFLGAFGSGTQEDFNNMVNSSK